MKKLIIVFFFLILLPLTINASQDKETHENYVNSQNNDQAKDGYGDRVQHEAGEAAPNVIEPPDWGGDEFESSFSGTGEPSFGEDGDEGNQGRF